MAADDLRTALGDVRQALLAEHEQGASDAQLLTRFLEQRDEAALAALVRRHAPMVWGVCRRTLRNAADVEDAFQATFLVLVRKAASVRPREMVGNWLYGVARQTALKARATAARRGARERQVARMPEPEAKRDVRDDLSSLLDEELSRLPGKYRAVLVLCDLEGQPRPAAARQLGLPEGTIASRLARARTMLAKRLARHGLGVTAGSVAAALAAEAVAAPPALVSAAVRTAWAVASGQGGAVVSAQVGALTERVVKAMFLTQIKKAMAVLLALGAAALACGVLAAMRQTPAPPREGGPPAAGDAAPAREKAQRPLPADPLPAGAVAQFGSSRLQDFTIDRSTAFSPDGKLLATSGSNSPICVWDVVSGALARTQPNHGSVYDLRWRADGQLAALTFFGHDVFLMQGFGGGADLSAEDLQRLRQKADQRERRQAGGGNAEQEHLHHCFLSADGRLAVAVWNCGPKNRRRARVYRFASGQTSDTAKVECELAIPDGMNVWISGDGRWLLAHAQPAGDAPNKLCAFDLAARDKGKPAWELAFPGGYIEAAPDSCFSPDGKRVVILFWDDHVELWDGPGGKRLRRLPVLPKYYHQGNAEWRGIDVSADGKRLALITRGENGEMGGRVVDVATGRDVCRLAPRPLPRSSGSFGATRFSRDGKRVARVSYGVVGIWDAESGADACPLAGHRGGVNSLAVLAGGKRVATAGEDQTVRAWEPNTGQETWRVPLPQGMEVKLAIPDGPVVVQARAWGVVGPEGLPALCLDAATGRRRPLPGPLARAKKDDFLACSPDGKRVLTLDRQKPAFRIWSWSAGELLTTAPALPPPQLRLAHCTSAHFTPDGRHFAAVVYYDNAANRGLKDRAPDRPFVETWDATTGKRLGRTELQMMETPMLLPHPSGLYVLGKDAEVRDVLSGQLLVKLQAPPGQGLGLEWKRAAALSPDGRTVAVGVGFIGQQLLLFEARTGRYRTRLPMPGRSVTGLSFLPDGRLVSLGETATVWSVALQPADGADRDLDREWLRLGEPEPEKAWPAMRKMAGVSAEAVDFIRRRVRPVPKLSDETMRRIFRDLDADEFELREAASKELEQLGALAVPRARAVAAGNVSLELKRRLTRFLDRHDRAELPADELRALRAVEVLEAIATPAARKLLGELAEGESDARLTRDAAGALRRAGRP
jgi:RNA polymerase sigma factor (sigma-70 family)